MIKLVFRRVTLGTFLVALIAAPSFTPAFAMGAGGGGGGGGGTGGAGIPLIFFAPSDPPSAYPRRRLLLRGAARGQRQPAAHASADTRRVGEWSLGPRSSGRFS